MPPIRIISWNIHHGADKTGIFQPQRILSLLKKYPADIIGLQEVDKKWSARSNFCDLPALFAKELGMHFFFAPSIRLDNGKRQYGNLILSRFRINRGAVSQLDDNVYKGDRFTEPRTALSVSLKMPRGALKFICTHWGHTAKEKDKSAKRMVKELDTTPTILVGDFNATIESSFTGHIAGKLGAQDKLPGIDHVFTSKDFVLLGVWYIDNIASDHPLLYAKLQFKSHNIHDREC